MTAGLMRIILAMTSPITDNLARVNERIRLAEQRYQRPAGSVRLLAVSKTRSPEEILTAVSCGQRHFGENYLQEALEKISRLERHDLRWHFIGPVQSNKTRAIAGHFHWVHSVDRLKIARRLSEQRPSRLPALNICLQVNISDEATKSGLPLSELPGTARQIADLPNLQLRGLMAIPQRSGSFEQQRHPFHQLRQALQSLNREGLELDTLSMGMSSDMEAAIAEGATIVRIGTDIFGPRD